MKNAVPTARRKTAWCLKTTKETLFAATVASCRSARLLTRPTSAASLVSRGTTSERVVSAPEATNSCHQAGSTRKSTTIRSLLSRCAKRTTPKSVLWRRTSGVGSSVSSRFLQTLTFVLRKSSKKRFSTCATLRTESTCAAVVWTLKLQSAFSSRCEPRSGKSRATSSVSI